MPKECAVCKQPAVVAARITRGEQTATAYLCENCAKRVGKLFPVEIVGSAVQSLPKGTVIIPPKKQEEFVSHETLTEPQHPQIPPIPSHPHKTNKCVSCGVEIPDGAQICKNCEYNSRSENSSPRITNLPSSDDKPSSNNTNLTEPPASSFLSSLLGWEIIVGIIAICSAFILIGIGKNQLKEDHYIFCLDHYKTCVDGYNESIQTANSYLGFMFKSEYEGIADSYKKMAEDDLKEAWEYRTKTMVYVSIGIAALVSGISLILYKIQSYKSAPPYSNNSQPILSNSQEDISKSITLSARNSIIGAAILSSIIISISIISLLSNWNDFDSRSRMISSSINSSPSSSYSYTYTPTAGKEGALAQAESYLRSTAFSYEGLIEQLEFHGFSHDEAKYGADNCGADWKKQALRRAKSYLESTPFSYNSLIEQLEFSGFTKEEAKYGVNNCGADWNEQAVLKAKSYLKSISNWTRSRLIEQLEFSGFTSSQAKYGADNCGHKW